MYFKKGKSLGVFQKKENIRAGTYYEMIMIGDFLLILVSADDEQNGFFIYGKKSDENTKTFGIWRKQKDDTLYIYSQNDSRFGGYVAERRGDEYLMYEAETDNLKELQEFY
jgi:hypothetical protein